MPLSNYQLISLILVNDFNLESTFEWIEFLLKFEAVTQILSLTPKFKNACIRREIDIGMEIEIGYMWMIGNQNCLWMIITWMMMRIRVEKDRDQISIGMKTLLGIVTELE